MKELMTDDLCVKAKLFLVKLKLDGSHLWLHWIAAVMMVTLTNLPYNIVQHVFLQYFLI